MSAIKIFDASGVIYSGQYNDFGRTANYKGIPTGGLFLLLQKIGECVQRDIPFIIAVDSRTNKQLILPGYKGGRPRDPKIAFQNNMFYKYFGINHPNVHKVEGKEADTLIAKAVVDNYRNGQQQIDVVGADYDLVHNIDNAGLVRCVPANSKVGLVTRQNFEQLFSDNSKRVLFNSISMSKVFLGDGSDRVKAFEHPIAPEKLFNLFLGTCIKDGYINDQMKSLEAVENFKVKAAKFFDTTTLDEFDRRVQVIYPQEHLVQQDLSYQGVLDTKESLSVLLSLTGCKRLANRLGIRFYEDMGVMQDEVRRMYIETQEINKSRHFVTTQPTGQFTNNRGF